MILLVASVSLATGQGAEVRASWKAVPVSGVRCLRDAAQTPTAMGLTSADVCLDPVSEAHKVCAFPMCRIYFKRKIRLCARIER